jgi:hypothetical protein
LNDLIDGKIFPIAPKTPEKASICPFLVLLGEEPEKVANEQLFHLAYVGQVLLEHLFDKEYDESDTIFLLEA